MWRVKVGIIVQNSKQEFFVGQCFIYKNYLDFPYYFIKNYVTTNIIF